MNGWKSSGTHDNVLVASTLYPGGLKEKCPM